MNEKKDDKIDVYEELKIIMEIWKDTKKYFKEDFPFEDDPPKYLKVSEWLKTEQYKVSLSDSIWNIDEFDIMNSISKYLKKQGWEEVDDDKK